MPTRRLLSIPFLCVAIGLLSIGLAACGDDDDDTGAAQTTTETTTETEDEANEAGDDDGNAPAPSGGAVRSAKVEIVDFSYAPDPVTVEAGGKVTWINRDAEPHTATADDGSFDTGTLGEGKLGSESFKEAGTFAYTCTIHPEMQGTLEVVESG